MTLTEKQRRVRLQKAKRDRRTVGLTEGQFALLERAAMRGGPAAWGTKSTGFQEPRDGRMTLVPPASHKKPTSLGYLERVRIDGILHLMLTPAGLSLIEQAHGPRTTTRVTIDGERVHLFESWMQALRCFGNHLCVCSVGDGQWDYGVTDSAVAWLAKQMLVSVHDGVAQITHLGNFTLRSAA